VNRVRVSQRTALCDGDEVLAGETTFVIRVQGDASRAESPWPVVSGQPSSSAPPVNRAPDAISSAPSRPPAAPVEVAPSEPPVSSRAPIGPVSYTIESHSSGLTLCRGSIDQIAPAELAILLCGLLPAYLIVDFRKLSTAAPADLKSPQHLFDWLDPAAAAAVSPVLVSQDDLLTWPMLVEQGWGKDAVVCLFSHQEKGAMLDHLRRSCRANPHSESADGAILGCCWPSLLASLLSHFTATFVRDLMSGIDAVLVESFDPPRTWRIYGTGQVTKMLDQLGFRQEPA
jgi:hypothetical protein